MKYTLREPTTVEAFTVTEVSPDFHGHSYALLDSGDVIPTGTGTAFVGDFFVDGKHFAAKAGFDAEYSPAPLA